MPECNEIVWSFAFVSHMTQKHMSESKQQCTMCANTFNVWEIEDHVASKHEGSNVKPKFNVSFLPNINDLQSLEKFQTEKSYASWKKEGTCNHEIVYPPAFVENNCVQTDTIKPAQIEKKIKHLQNRDKAITTCLQVNTTKCAVPVAQLQQSTSTQNRNKKRKRKSTYDSEQLKKSKKQKVILKPSIGDCIEVVGANAVVRGIVVNIKANTNMDCTVTINTENTTVDFVLTSETDWYLIDENKN